MSAEKIAFIKSLLSLKQEHEALDKIKRSCTDWNPDEVTELEDLIKLHYKKIHDIESKDPLTGLLSRNSIMIQLEHQLALNKRALTPFTLVFLDLDNFKDINRELGHEGGNKLLQQTADFLRENSRSVDSVARYGGDEFIVLLANCSPEDAPVWAERLIKKARLIDQAPFSMGLISINKTEMPPVKIVAKADQAMYEAKRTDGYSMYQYTES